MDVNKSYVNKMFFFLHSKRFFEVRAFRTTNLSQKSACETTLQKFYRELY